MSTEREKILAECAERIERARERLLDYPLGEDAILEIDRELRAVFLRLFELSGSKASDS